MKIKVVLLDLGGVCYKIDWNRPLENLKIPAQPENFFWKLDAYDALEKGHLSLSEFQSAYEAKLQKKFSTEDFEKAFGSVIVEPHPGLEDLLKKVRLQKPLYALSNISEPHEKVLRQMGSELDQFHRTFMSYEMGIRKPSSEIYQKVVDELRVSPSEVLFVDDLPANLEGAASIGLKVATAKDSLEDLRKILYESGCL